MNWPTPWDDWSLIYTVFLCENCGRDDCLGEGPMWDQFMETLNPCNACADKAKEEGWVCLYEEAFMTNDLKCYCPVCWAKIMGERNGS